ncbi:MAG: V-type ATP synthase subunit K [Candidatus Gastranaerophilaceae bacterium]|jgi:V/A-type H+-transporting ATPase subunit K|nr:V-type ATP synthase subunit K [Christensenellales bacterium]
MFENVEWGTIFTALGVVLSLVLPGIGSAIGVARAGQAAAGVVAEQPENFFKCMIVQLLPGSQGIYGLVIAFMILSSSGLMGGTAPNVGVGLQMLAASLPMAFGGLVSAIQQSKVAVAGINIIGKRSNGLMNAMLLTLMVELYALFALLISIMMI